MIHYKVTTTFKPKALGRLLLFLSAIISPPQFGTPASAAPDASPAAVSYPWPQGPASLQASDIRATVDGKPEFVYALMHQGMTYGTIPNVASEFISFEFHRGSATVELTYSDVRINSARVYTLGTEIPSICNGNKVTFSVSRAGIYAVEVNNDIRQRGPVLVFANTFVRKNLSFAPTDIVFKPGTVTDAGVIHITKPNQRVYIPGGAIVRGLIEVDNADSVWIGGQGVLLYDDQTTRQPDVMAVPGNSPVLAINAHDLTLDDLTIIVSPTTFTSGPHNTPVAPWAVHILRSSAVKINHIKVLNGLRDGIDIDGSNHINVRNSFVQSHDDSLAIKSTNFGPDGGAHGYSVTDVIFENMMLINEGTGNALQIGVELHAPEVTRVSYRNIDIIHALGRQSAAISITNGDAARVHNIQYSNIHVLNPLSTLLRLSITKDGYLPDIERGYIDNLVFHNLRVDAADANTIASIRGFDLKHTVSDVKFVNLNVGTTKTLHITNENAPYPLLTRTSY